MTERSTEHTTFVLERRYAASPARVFAAWADPVQKAQWFVGPDEWIGLTHEADFRPVGGRVLRPSGGQPDAQIRLLLSRTIAPDQRIIYSYIDAPDLRIPMSISLTTVERRRIAAARG